MNTLQRRVVAVVLVAAVALALGLAVVTPAPALGQEDGADPILSALEPLIQVIRYLDAYYHEDLDLAELVRGAVDGVLGVLDDPNTTFFAPSEYEDVQIDLGGSYSGVGMYIEQRGEYVVVQSLIPGSPAERGGLQPGDRIVKVDGKDVVGEQPGVVGSLIRGPEGTEVVITIQRGEGQPFDVRLVRRTIELPSVEAELKGNDIGYIRIYQFYDGVSEKVQVAYDRFVTLGVKGIVLDLRNNPGGLLNEAIQVSRVFVPRGAIVHIVSGGGDQTTYNAHPHPPGPPVAVLVDGGSASASEIVAAAIRENGVGILVGARTFGKGTVQSIVEFDDGSAFKFTTAEYLTPTRRSIDGTGLQPDVEVGGAAQAQAPELGPLSGRYALRRGSRGLEVEGLQQRLNYLGYDAGPADGVFGGRTDAALRAFQRDQGLAVSGRLDSATYEALNRAVTARAEASARTEEASGGDRALERALELLRSGQWRAVLGG